MQEKYYHSGTSNHEEHNVNPLYWGILLRDIIAEPEKWTDKNALDFGCGKGRNVINMAHLAQWNRVDGVDISEGNIKFCEEQYKGVKDKVHWYLNNGIDLEIVPSDTYDFVMATIVFQHICIYEIRFALLKEIYRTMRDGGIFRFQMGFDKDNGSRAIVKYHENFYDAPATNSGCDTRVDDPQYIKNDLEKIGFKNIEFIITQSFSDHVHPQWIYTRCEK